MTEGIIELDTPFAQRLGFTSDKFEGYLWKDDRFIVLSFIISKQEGKGNLSKLFKRIQERGYGIKVPTPFSKMVAICDTHGFKRTWEYSEDMKQNVLVWVKESPLLTELTKK